MRLFIFKFIVALFLAIPVGSFGNIVHLEMNDVKPHPIPVHPAVTISIKFPYPIDGLDGAGFTSDLKHTSGEFLISYSSPNKYFSISPLTKEPRPRNLNVVIGDKITVLKPYVVSDPSDAWNVVIFEDNSQKKEEKIHSSPQVTKHFYPPTKTLKTSSTAKIIGMLDTTKLISQVNENILPSLLKTMPSITVSLRKNEYFDFGTHRIFLDIVSRNSELDVLVFGVRVINDSKTVLKLDPESFTARVGDFVYTQVVSDFKCILEPGETSIGYFAIVGTAEGSPNYLSPNNKFRVSLDILDQNETATKK